MTIVVVIPVHNEETILENNIRRVHAFMARTYGNSNWQIVIAENGSTDNSKNICETLVHDLSHTSLRTAQVAGKGKAVLDAWRSTDADISLFIDADLAPHLSIIPALINSVEEGFDIAVGSRMHANSQVNRTIARRCISRINNVLRKILFATEVHDTACGVKAINHRTLREIIPLVKNRSWFFDTEMIIRAHAQHFSIKEIPVIWSDRSDKEGVSKINIALTSWEYVREMIRVKNEIRQTTNYSRSR